MGRLHGGAVAHFAPEELRGDWWVPKLKGWIGEGSNLFELFRSEFDQNSWNPKKTTKSTGAKNSVKILSKFCHNSVHVARKFKKFRIFQHLRKY